MPTPSACSRLPRLGLPLLLAACLAGCTELGGGGAAVTMKVSGGRTMTFLIDRKTGPVPAENDDFKVLTSGFLPVKGRHTGFYAFDVLVKRDGAPRRVTVDDVTEDSPMRLVDDEKPGLHTDEKKQLHWRGTSRTLGAADPEMKWVYQIDDGYRIYRFTIVTEDGRTVRMYQASFYPGFYKMLLRKGLGITGD